jgi:hypothetical protein
LLLLLPLLPLKTNRNINHKVLRPRRRTQHDKAFEVMKHIVEGWIIKTSESGHNVPFMNNSQTRNCSINLIESISCTDNAAGSEAA